MSTKMLLWRSKEDISTFWLKKKKVPYLELRYVQADQGIHYFHNYMLQPSFATPRYILNYQVENNYVLHFS